MDELQAETTFMVVMDDITGVAGIQIAEPHD